MGDGVAVEPTGETVVAPADATITVVMEDSRHACGMAFDNGVELLIHVGIDTVDMNGDGFELFEKSGDRVTRGTTLIRFSKEKIKKAGHPATTMMIITEPGSGEITFSTGMEAQAGKTTVAVCKGE